MPAMYPTKSKEKYAYILYGSHIPVITGLEKEVINLEEISTIEDVISKLDEKYPGFKDIFLPPGGIFNSRTAITLTKVGQPGSAVIDQKQKIEAGAVLLFW